MCPQFVYICLTIIFLILNIKKSSYLFKIHHAIFNLIRFTGGKLGMVRQNKWMILSCIVLMLFFLIACGGYKESSKKNQAEVISETERQQDVSKIDKKLIDKKKVSQKDELVTVEPDKDPIIQKADDDNAPSDKNVIQTGDERIIKNGSDAISLYQYYLKIDDDQKIFAAKKSKDGFTLTSINSFSRYAPVVIKYNGDAYNQAGKLVHKFSTLAASYDERHPEQGWRGY